LIVNSFIGEIMGWHSPRRKAALTLDGRGKTAPGLSVSAQFQV
jgi:hypothetical protein